MMPPPRVRPAPAGDGAVSEVVGQLLILVIVMLSVGIVYSTGLPVLGGAQDAIQFEATRQGFLVLQSDVNKALYDQSPVKTTVLQMGGGSLGLGTGGTLDVRAVNASGVAIYSTSLPLTQVEYLQGENRLAFVNGGVLLMQGGGGAVLSPPKLFVYEDVKNGEVVLASSLSRLRNATNTATSFSGKGTVRVQATYNTTNVTLFESGGGRVYLNFTAPVYYPAWRNFFTELRGKLSDTAALVVGGVDEEINVTVYYDKLQLTEHVVDLRLT